ARDARSERQPGEADGAQGAVVASYAVLAQSRSSSYPDGSARRSLARPRGAARLAPELRAASVRGSADRHASAPLQSASRGGVSGLDAPLPRVPRPPRSFDAWTRARRGLSERAGNVPARAICLLEQRMSKPRIFLGSSGKQTKLLEALTRGLEDVAHVEPWTTSFNPGTTTLERLLELTREVDFAAFVFAQDDWTTVSPSADPAPTPAPTPGQASPRDNVVFEAGLFGGVLGMRRTFI